MSCLAELRNSTNETARIARGNLLFFLVVGLFLGILVAGVDDMALLTQSHVVVPLMQVAVSIEVLFGAGPVLFLLLHLNLFVRLNRLYHVSQQLRARIEAAGGPDRRTMETALLFPLDFLQLLHYRTGREAIVSDRVSGNVALLRWRSLRWLARFMEWMVKENERSGNIFLMIVLVSVPVFLFPLALLMAVQMRFLPYQNETLTYVHQVCVSVDLAFQFVFVARLDPVRRFVSMIWKGNALERAGYLTYVAYAMLFLVLCPVFVWSVAVVPGSWLERHRPFPETMSAASLLLFGDWWEGTDCSLSGIARPRLFRRYMYVVDKTVSAGGRDEEIVAAYLARDEDPEQAWQFVEELDLGNRSFRYAWFNGSSFWRTRFERSELDCASFEESRLNGVDLTSARAPGAEFGWADLTGAQLNRGRFEGASFYRARLHGAEARRARFTGADFREAGLHGADLSGSRFRAADFRDAEFFGTDLTNAEMRGSNADRASFYSARLSEAEVEATTFRKARFYEVDMNGAAMALVDFRGSQWEMPPNWIRIRQAIEAATRKRFGKAQRTRNELRPVHTAAEDKPVGAARGPGEQARCAWTDRRGRFAGWGVPHQSCREDLQQVRVELACAKGQPAEAAGVAGTLMPIGNWPDVDVAVALLKTDGEACAGLDAALREKLCFALTGWYRKQRFEVGGSEGDAGREQDAGTRASWEELRTSGVCEEL